jgi:hypothetical protein
MGYCLRFRTWVPAVRHFPTSRNPIEPVRAGERVGWTKRENDSKPCHWEGYRGVDRVGTGSMVKTTQFDVCDKW